MGIVVVCSALVVLGLLVIVRWGGLEFEPPRESDDVVGRYIRSVAVATAAGTGAGLLMSGAGGRLAMRLLAATAGDGAHGKLTEAEEIVGEITVGGTIGFVVFIGLFLGLATGALYMVIRRWLPAGRLGGLAYGGLLLVLFAPAFDPLRKNNEDFDIVGPGWLSVLVFVALGLAHGMLVAAIAARYSRALPAFSTDRAVLVRYAPLLLLLPLVTPAGIVVLVGLVVVALSRVADIGAALRSRRALLVGRAVLILGAAVAAPTFVSAVIDIAGRGPQ